MAKVLAELKDQYAGKVTAEKIDIGVAENREIAMKYNVRYVPHLLFMNASGDVVKENVGYMPLTEVVKTFKEAGVDL